MYLSKTRMQDFKLKLTYLCFGNNEGKVKTSAAIFFDGKLK